MTGDNVMPMLKRLWPISQLMKMNMDCQLLKNGILKIIGSIVNLVTARSSVGLEQLSSKQ